MDEPLELPGYAPLSRDQMIALARAARRSVALAREQIGPREPGRVSPWWRRLITTSRRAPLERDVSTIAINALSPLRQVCQELPAESAKLLAVLAAQAVLVEALRADLAAAGHTWAATRTTEETGPLWGKLWR